MAAPELAPNVQIDALELHQGFPVQSKKQPKVEIDALQEASTDNKAINNLKEPKPKETHGRRDSIIATESH